MYTKEELDYLDYKEAYYLGNPKISDPEFDKFEDALRKKGSKVVEIVGYTIKNKKDVYDHPSHMLSLEKLQVNDEENIPLDELEKWMAQMPGSNIEMSPKYDGNAINCIYQDGVLIKALTRGSKTQGFERINKLKHLVPNTILLKGTVQIRGEIVITDKEYQKYRDPEKISNARNFVAGILNRDEVDFNIINDLVFVAYSCLLNNGYIDNTMQQLENFGFNNIHKPFLRNFSNISDFPALYKEFKHYRKNMSEFLLDGIVLKFPESIRPILSETDHHPRWGLAVKFETDIVETEILDIIWNVSTTGELSPVAILKPVELLGTIVQKASLYNLGSIITMRSFPGATVKIRKSGEIIPQILSVVIPSPNEDEYLKQYEERCRV